MFEVTKAEEEEKNNNSPPMSPNAGSNMSGQSHGLSNAKASALRVTIPSELQGVAYIEVLCQKGNIIKKLIHFLKM
jgi:mediator of RNA polymerase II transcription subunit 17